ncbi:MAG: hypothetical protein ACE5NG_14050 [bacterium]
MPRRVEGNFNRRKKVESIPEKKVPVFGQGHIYKLEASRTRFLIPIIPKPGWSFYILILPRLRMQLLADF